MAYNKAREERRWKEWKEKEEQQLRSLGMNEVFNYQDGRRLALSGGTVTLRLHRNPQGNRKERRAEPMDILGLIAVLSFGLTCFGIGYSIGKDSNKTQK